MKDMKSPTVGILSVVLNKSIHIICYKVKNQSVSAAVLQQSLNKTILREARAHKISPSSPSSSTALLSPHPGKYYFLPLTAEDTHFQEVKVYLDLSSFTPHS